jgi:nucleoside-diphosphate-sugar epimerase
MTVYGASQALPVNEREPLAPTFPYALGKVLAEDVLNASALPDLWILRLPGLFAAERQSGALYHFIRAGLERRPIALSAREPTPWDLLHVDDAVEAIVRALASPEPFRGSMNVSYGERVNIERIARGVSALTTGVDIVNETSVVHPEFQLDITRARQRLGWPPCSLESRIEQMISRMRQERV